MAKKTMTYVILSMGVLALGYGIWKTTFRNAYETANYSLVAKDSNFELRRYPDLKVAKTNTSSTMSGDRSFGRLFGYISGTNETRQTIAMTTPVFMLDTADDSTSSMSFVLPEELSGQNIPQPSNPQVEIGNRPGGLYAVIRYSGRDSGNGRLNQTAVLEEWIQNQGLIVVGETEFASYDPPWTPGFFRRNEILIHVQEKH